MISRCHMNLELGNAWNILECVLRVMFSMMSILLLSEFWYDPVTCYCFSSCGPHLTTDLHNHSHWFAQILHAQRTAIVAPQIDTLTRCGTTGELGNQLPTGAGVDWCSPKPIAIQAAQGLGSEGGTQSCRLDFRRLSLAIAIDGRYGPYLMEGAAQYG